MLRPLHVWKLNADGTVKRDSHGHRVPHAKKGQAKTADELTDADRAVMARQLHDQEERQKALDRIEAQEALFRAALTPK